MANDYDYLTKKSINVLSLFDGVSTAYVALERAGFKINKYMSSEIDKSALKVQQAHYGHLESFIQLGDVKTVDVVDILDTDLVIFGSPCTSLTAINPKTPELGLNGPASGLFWEAIRILKELKQFRFHKEKGLYFICENVASMSNKNRDAMTLALKEVFPETQLIKIDSALVSASHRRRYYWTNIPNLTQPEPTHKKYVDVIENGYVDKDKANVLLGSNITLTGGLYRYYKRNIGNIVFKDKDFSELPAEQKLAMYPKIQMASGYLGKSKRDADVLDFPNGCYRLLAPLEAERCLGFDDGYISSVSGVSKTEMIKMVGLSFSPDVIAHIAKPLKSL
jgi:site-specific DNA-cytosine methylase